MILGFDFMGKDDGLTFNSNIILPNYTRVELSNSIVDDIYVTTDLATSQSTVKPTQWGYSDVLNADFTNDSLEGGSIAFTGSIVDHVQLQKRLASDLLWQVMKTISYTSGTTVLLNVTDNFVQNDTVYQYALVPISNNIQGNQILDPKLTVIASFNGNFITDSTYNYQLMYNSNFDSLVNNTVVGVLEPLDSQYPIVVTNNLNYKSGKLTATLLSDATLEGNGVSINQEYQLRQKIMSFINNRQPKLLRNMFGDNILIMITDKPQITYLSGNVGMASISFSFVEIGDATNLSTLALNGLVV